MMETALDLSSISGSATTGATALAAAASVRPIDPHQCLDFPRLLHTLIERIASSGLEGRSFNQLFSLLEWIETERLKERELAERRPPHTLIQDESTNTTSNVPKVDTNLNPITSIVLDPWIRYHIVRLLMKRDDIEFYCKQPPTNTTADQTITPTPTAAPTTEQLQNDSDIQLTFLKQLVESLRTQEAANPLSRLNTGGAVGVWSNLPTDPTILESALAGGNGSWIYTGNGLLHISSFNRIRLLPATIESLGPEDVEFLSSNLVLVASFSRRCRFLGLTEDDVNSLRAFSPASTKSTTSVILPDSTPFVMYNLLETIGKFSLTTPAPPITPITTIQTPFASSSTSAAASSSSYPTHPNHGGILQLHIGRLLQLSSGNLHRFLQILENRSFITSIRMDDVSGGPSGAPWRWFITHYAPSMHAAARNLTALTPFTSLGTLSADFPLLAFQSEVHLLYQYYRQMPWKVLRRKIKIEKDKEFGPLQSVDENKRIIKDEKSPAADRIKMEDAGDSTEAKIGSGRFPLTSFPKLDIQTADAVSSAFVPTHDFVLNSSFIQQAYRLIVARGVSGTTTTDMREHFHNYYTMKQIHQMIQTLINKYEVKSIADQTGKARTFRFFTKDAFDQWHQTHGATTGQTITNTVDLTDASPSPTLGGSTAVGHTLQLSDIHQAPLPKTNVRPSRPRKSKTSEAIVPDGQESKESTSAGARLASSKGGQTRVTLKSIQREAWTLECLRASPDHMVRASDVSRYLLDKEVAADSSTRPTDEIHVDRKTCLRVWNRLEATKQIQQVHVSVEMRTGGFKDVHLLLLGDVDWNDQQVKVRAIALANVNQLTGKQLASQAQKRRYPSNSRRSRRATIDTDESEEDDAAMEEHNDYANEILRDMGMIDESQVPISTPKTKKKKEEINEGEEDEITTEGQLSIESPRSPFEELLVTNYRFLCLFFFLIAFYPVTHGLIRPRITRLRLLLDRLWTIYSSPEMNVKPISAMKKVKKGKGSDEQKMDAPQPTTLAQSVAIAAAHASNVNPSSNTLPTLPMISTPSFLALHRQLSSSSPRCVNFTFLLTHFRLRDWMSLIGVREEDFKDSFEANMVFGTYSNFDRSVNDPLIAPWCRDMITRQRTLKVNQLRQLFDIALSMGLISEGLSTSDDRSYYILEPRFTLLGDNMDLSSQVGRDEFWRRLRETSLRVNQSKLRQQPVKTEPIPVAQAVSTQPTTAADSQPTIPSLAPSSRSPPLPPLESHSQILEAQLQMLPPAAAVQPNLPFQSTPIPPPLTAVPAMPYQEPILQQFPHPRFRELYRKASWVVGKPLESSVTMTTPLLQS